MRVWSRSLTSRPRRRISKGQLFREIVVDYPLAQAVEDGIVKTPLIGEIGGPVEVPATNAADRYRQWIEAGVARWRKFAEELGKAGKRPILFIMAEDTQSADEIGDYLRILPDFKGDQTLVIHTDRKGEIKKGDLDMVRTKAREVDSDQSGINAIVSVLMLREGWDVRNVCVIVGLRKYTAASRILPEQTLGRGLRRMSPPNSGWDERLVVIEHDAFRDLWDSELAADGLVVGRGKADKIGTGATTIFVDQEKVAAFDVALPQLSRSIRRATNYISGLTLDDVPSPPKPLEVPTVSPEEYIKYRGLHLISKKLIEQGEFHIPVPGELVRRGRLLHAPGHSRSGPWQPRRSLRHAAAVGARLHPYAAVRGASRARGRDHPVPADRRRRPRCRERGVPACHQQRQRDERIRERRGPADPGQRHRRVPVVEAGHGGREASLQQSRVRLVARSQLRHFLDHATDVSRLRQADAQHSVLARIPLHNWGASLLLP